MQKQMHVLLCSTRERKTYFSCTTALHTATAVTHTHSENIFLAKRIIQSNCSDTRKEMVYKHRFSQFTQTKNGCDYCNCFVL